jgi:D-xylulose reductase
VKVRELRTESVFRYAHMYPKSIALLESGSLDIKPIITNHFNFEDSVAAGEPSHVVVVSPGLHFSV